MNYSEITPYIRKMAELSSENNGIRPQMYAENQVFRGLRDLNGKGVVTGLTEVSDVRAKKLNENGELVPCPGELYYRGININSLVDGFYGKRFGFEEAIYLLLFSKLPTKDELEEFKWTLASYRSLPQSFVRDMILKAPGKDMMNILSRSVLALYAYDDNPDDISVENVLRQCLQLISTFHMLAVYAYNSYQHYHRGKSLFIHVSDPDISIA
jgi:citrate synthase